MSYRFLFVYIIIISLFTGFLYPPKIHAASPSSILINMSPENPDAYENVDINLNSYANNLDTVFISWSVDGKILLSGVGKKSFSLTAPGIDTEKTVLVKVTLPDGDVELRILIKPTNIVMLWQADDSYVPPFYKGKALPSPGSSIKIVAMPEIRNGANLVDPKNMSYSWRRDYSNDQQASGFGKNYYIYSNDFLEDSSAIDVSALTVDQRYSAAGNVTVGSTNPKILFYRRDLKMGTMWENALQNNYKIQNDEVLEAAPFFISPQNPITPILSWSWYINNEQIDAGTTMSNIMPLKITPGTSGTAKILLKIDNNYKIYQSTQKQISVQF